ALGYAGSAVPMLAAFSVAGASAAVGLTYLAARRLGASVATATGAAAVLGATAVMWRAGGSAGVYGVAFGAAALAWVAAARYVRRPDAWRAGALGVAAGAMWSVLVAGTAVGVLSGRRLVRARGVGRIVAAALLLHAGLAFAGAAGYQPLRAEYFGLGFVPLAILAALGSPSRPVARRR